MNITIKPGAATDDAKQIERIVNSIKEDMEVLNSAIHETIPEEIQTSWSETLLDNWDTYYKGDVPEAMVNMGFSAKNLQAAVEEALMFDREAN